MTTNTFEATIRITHLPNIEDKDLLARTVCCWLDGALADGIEEHILESYLEDVGIVCEEDGYLNWEIDDEVSLRIVEKD